MFVSYYMPADALKRIISNLLAHMDKIHKDSPKYYDDEDGANNQTNETKPLKKVDAKKV